MRLWKVVADECRWVVGQTTKSTAKSEHDKPERRQPFRSIVLRFLFSVVRGAAGHCGASGLLTISQTVQHRNSKAPQSIVTSRYSAAQTKRPLEIIERPFEMASPCNRRNRLSSGWFGFSVALQSAKRYNFSCNRRNRLSESWAVFLFSSRRLHGAVHLQQR
jgi:hypothetical protein